MGSAVRPPSDEAVRAAATLFGVRVQPEAFDEWRRAADSGIVEDRDRWRRVAEVYRERLTALVVLFEDIGEHRIPSYVEGYEAAEYLLGVLEAGAVAEGETIAAPLSPYRVGDPDPTPNEFGPECNASIPNGSGWYWYCTWRPGHTGDHVAGNGERVCFVWPQTPTTAGAVVEGES